MKYKLYKYNYYGEKSIKVVDDENNNLYVAKEEEMIKVYNYLKNFKKKNKVRKNEIFKEIRIVKGLMKAKNYKYPIKERIADFSSKIEKKSKEIYKKSIEYIKKIKVEEILGALSTFGIMSIFSSMVYQLSNSSELLWQPYFYGFIVENTKSILMFSVPLISVFYTIVNYEDMKKNGFKIIIANTIFALVTSLYLTLIISINAGNIYQNLNEYSFNSLITNKHYKELDKKISNKFNKDFTMSDNIIELLIKISNTENHELNKIYNDIERKDNLSVKELEEMLKTKIEEIKKEIIKKEIIKSKSKMTIKISKKEIKEDENKIEKPELEKEKEIEVDKTDIKSIEKSTNNEEALKEIRNLKSQLQKIEELLKKTNESINKLESSL